MPDRFKRIYLAIDQLPSQLDFNVQTLSDPIDFLQDLENRAASEMSHMVV
jgi:hypothetical protein